MPKTSDEWSSEFEKRKAFWVHCGKPEQPHVILTGGKHSGGYFNSEFVSEEPFFLGEACLELGDKLEQSGLDLNRVDRVVGPAMGAIAIAHEIARYITVRNKRACLRAYAEKAIFGDHKIMVFHRTNVCRGEYVLLVEDTVTTGGSTELTAQAVTSAGGNVLPFVACFVNRSPFGEVNGRKIVSLVERHMPTWRAEECPLCIEKGSRAVYPKVSLENWALLNAKY